MPTQAEFLIERLKQHVDTIFGIPGDYILNFFNQLDKEFNVITTTDEQNAGFAADAYARCRGFGVVCATYCVGGFKLLNPIAGAFAEKSPVLFISGAPGVNERNKGLLLHHAAGPYECQHKVFQNVTCASAVLDDPTRAGFEIDRVIDTMLRCKQPGYLELPRDRIDSKITYDVYNYGNPAPPYCDEENLQESLEKTLEWIRTARNPVILAGVELARYDMGLALTRFAERCQIPIATTLLSKSVINENHPLSLGVYCGEASQPHIKNVVEQSDCVLMLGVMHTDINMGFKPFKCNRTNVVQANADGRIRIRRSTYDNVPFDKFTSELLKVTIPKEISIAIPAKVKNKFEPKDARITSARLFEKINSILNENMAIIADIGDSLFGASELVVHHRNHFISPAFYTSMGNSVPGALGVQSANPKCRPIVIVGDGAFQMTGMELSTIARLSYNPIVFVLNNKGYTTERFLGYDGKYNNTAQWSYHRVFDLIDAPGKGYEVHTEEDLENAVESALKSTKFPSIINVVVDSMDATPALRRITEKLSQHV